MVICINNLLTDWQAVLQSQTLGKKYGDLAQFPVQNFLVGLGFIRFHVHLELSVQQNFYSLISLLF